jgi:hypothetical protein
MKPKGRSAARTASDRAERVVGTFDKPNHITPCTAPQCRPTLQRGFFVPSGTERTSYAWLLGANNRP